MSINRNIAIAGKVLHLLLEVIGKFIKPGITGKDINLFAEKCINNYGHGCKLACKGYNNFPASLCISINENIIHGIPNDKEIKEGDLVKVDIVIEYNGWYADSAKTFVVGKTNKINKKLIKVTEQCLYKAIKITHKGTKTGDIGYVIERYAIKNGFSVMKKFCGHGIGTKIHQEPHIPCYGNKKEGYILKEGMYICIEPMLFIGNPDITMDKEGYNVRAIDNNYTAHFEHTIYIGKKKSIIIT